ncbi:MAG: hypothetical protein V7K83_26850 [Nostoc sp.]
MVTQVRNLALVFLSRQELLLPNGLPNLLIQNFYSSPGEKQELFNGLLLLLICFSVQYRRSLGV